MRTVPQLVSDELADACTQVNAMLFDLKKGQPLDIKLFHLQGVDCFCEQLLSGLNLAMMELAYSKAQEAERRCREAL